MNRFALPVAVLTLSVAAVARGQVVATLDAPGGGPVVADGAGWAATLRPLYGGSDRSAFAVDLSSSHGWDSTDFNPTAGQTSTVTVLDVPLPADVRSGDAVVGRVWQESNRTSGADPYNPLAVGVATDAGGDGWVGLPVWGTPVGAPFDGPVPPPVRLPVVFDPAHRPARLRVRLRWPTKTPTDTTAGFAGLRLVRGTGASPEPATRPTADPTPPWPPADAVAAVVRTFDGNDFDAHLTRNPLADDPVDFGYVAGTWTPQVTVHVPAPAGLRAVPVVAVDDPGVTAGRFAVTGSVTYQGADGAADVDGFGYLELVADFADGPPAVVSGLAGSGPMRAIRGRSGERPFVLPVDGRRRPTRVRLNLVLSGTAQVTLSDLKLVQYDPAPPATSPVVATPAAADADPLRAEEADLSHELYAARLPLTDSYRLEMAAGLAAVRDRLRRPVSADAGRALHVELGAVRTRLAGPRAPRPVRRGPLVALSPIGTVLGLLACGGAVALAVGLGWWAAARAVWTGVAVVAFGWATAILGADGPWAAAALLLACAAAAAAGPVLGPVLGRRRREAELRRMRALDAVAA